MAYQEQQTGAGLFHLVRDLLVRGITRAIVLRGVDMDSPVAPASLAALYADQPVLHAGRRATFLHMSGGVAIIRYWGGSHAVAVPPESLSLRPTRRTAGSMRLAASDEPTARESAEVG